MSDVVVPLTVWTFGKKNSDYCYMYFQSRFPIRMISTGVGIDGLLNTVTIK